MNCDVCSAKLPDDYYRLPWDLQRPFHRFYCVRCKRCLHELDAAPGLPGWCKMHWLTRMGERTPPGFKPADRKTARKYRREVITETYHALEQEVTERLGMTPDEFVRNTDFEKKMQDILDIAAKRKPISKTEIEPKDS